MNTFNILSDWYFCCCINCGSKHTQVYLSILETLDNHKSDETSVATAYEDLMLTDLSMRIYAARHVLSSGVIHKYLEGNHQNIKKYFGPLIDLVPDNILREYLRDLLH